MAAFVVTTAWVLAACETQGVEATQSRGEPYVPQKAEAPPKSPTVVPPAPAPDEPEAKTKPAVPQTYGQLRRQPNSL